MRRLQREILASATSLYFIVLLQWTERAAAQAMRRANGARRRMTSLRAKRSNFTPRAPGMASARCAGLAMTRALAMVVARAWRTKIPPRVDARAHCRSVADRCRQQWNSELMSDRGKVVAPSLGLMVRSAAQRRVSDHGDAASLRDAALGAAPQDEGGITSERLRNQHDRSRGAPLLEIRVRTRRVGERVFGADLDPDLAARHHVEQMVYRR
jgi:hypothetical protein